MRLIKLAILSFVFLFLLITIISLFIPGDIRISKAINVAAGDSTTFGNVDDLQKWKIWHPALKDLPENEIKSSADNLVVRNTIISVVQRKKDEVITEMSTPNSRYIESSLRLIRHINSDSATLQWYMQFKLRWYPWEKFKSLFYENIYGVQMEQGLANLKQLSLARRS
jgi:hypothetical protein